MMDLGPYRFMYHSQLAESGLVNSKVTIPDGIIHAWGFAEEYVTEDNASCYTAVTEAAAELLSEDSYSTKTVSSMSCWVAEDNKLTGYSSQKVIDARNETST
jgi:hypothetical protein